MAQLRGKLSTEIWLESEDLLTSAVFGTLKNLEPSLTVDLLSLAQPLAGSTAPLLALPLSWRFWPRWETCEPDIVVEDDRNLCVIEAKLYSEFGEDMGGGSQLRREWSDGLRRAREVGKELWLVTLTNHGSVPEEAIRRQLVRTTANLSRVCWLSWLEIARLLRDLTSEAAGPWKDDLLELLSRMGLAPFDGFREVTAHSSLVPALVPWTDRVFLGEQRPGAVGFRGVVELAQSLTVPSTAGWRLPFRVGNGTAGSARPRPKSGARQEATDGDQD